MQIIVGTLMLYLSLNVQVLMDDVRKLFHSHSVVSRLSSPAIM
jgi:hypothetical protein